PNRKSAGAAPATAAPEQSTDAPHPHTASQIAATSLLECRPPSPGSAATDDRSARASPAIHNWLPACCLLRAFHSPPDSLMRRTSFTKVSENRVFQQAAKVMP